ncbi:hypothetical protein Aduo_015575 [Ancylostoma duodenale]
MTDILEQQSLGSPLKLSRSIFTYPRTRAATSASRLFFEGSKFSPNSLHIGLRQRRLFAFDAIKIGHTFRLKIQPDETHKEIKDSLN